MIRKQNFYPRSPCGERHTSGRKWRMQMEFLSTLSLRRATLQAPPPRRPQRHFYPRSPCGERPTITGIIYSDRKISIHALLAESDDTLVTTHVIFCAYFYPRSPCGERRERGLQDHSSTDISIHALLAESDVTVLAVLVTGQDISIHALLAESDRHPNPED